MKFLKVMNHGSLFSGIGGFDLASRWCGWNNIFQVENDKFCIKVLKKNFPKVKKYEDIKKFNGKEYEGKIDVVSGGFPCQPFSIAGKRKSSEDNRYLWHEMFRVVSEIKPAWVVAENVRGIVSVEKGMVFEQVQADLENIGYEVQPFIIPACAKNAPHRRDRIWIVAYSDKNRTLGIRRKRSNNNKKWNSEKKIQEQQNQFAGTKQSNRKINPKSGSQGQLQQKRIEQDKRGRACDSVKNVADIDRERFQEYNGTISIEKKSITRETWERNWLEVATSLCRVADGVSKGLDETLQERFECKECGNKFGVNDYKENIVTCPNCKNDSIYSIIDYSQDYTQPSNRVDRLKALGNAIVPQVAYEIFKAIDEIMNNE